MSNSRPAAPRDPAPAADASKTSWDFLRPFREHRFGRLPAAGARFLDQVIELLRISEPDSAQVLKRIKMMERDIVLPIKVAGIAILMQSLYHMTGEVAKDLELPDLYVRAFFWIYVGINAIYGAVLLAMRRLPQGLVEFAVYGMSLTDGIFLGVLTVVTMGYNSPLYWVFLGLIARCSVSVPRATSQLLLNLTLSTCFVMAGVIDSYIAKTADESTQKLLEMYKADNPAEPLLLRMVLLLLMTFGCYAVQVLLERQRQALEEAREFAMREVQLRAAGRLAAEFAHQIKNPLAIINTAAFSLRRALRERRNDMDEKIQMIQEEVERADLIITQVMGYAQLSEGHVEKLNVLEELDSAIGRVFPPAAQFPVQVHRSYAASLPPLFMQRRHASEAFINVLQNAREALGERGGNVHISAQCVSDQAIEVVIHDDGPGIPMDKQGKIFEAYYTTKEKGTGLGLATVRHNVELYGGAVRVESELGKGARFVLIFPAKMLLKVATASG
jgi:signal transduction histidine kinase